MKTKVCTRCKIEKPVTEFYPNRARGPGAFRPECKQCKSKIGKVGTSENKSHPWRKYSSTRKSRV